MAIVATTERASMVHACLELCLEHPRAVPERWHRVRFRSIDGVRKYIHIYIPKGNEKGERETATKTKHEKVPSYTIGKQQE